MRCVMRHAWTPKFQLSGPTVHSLYCVPVVGGNTSVNVPVETKETEAIMLLLKVIVQIRVGGLPPISKHREELKLRGEAEHF